MFLAATRAERLADGGGALRFRLAPGSRTTFHVAPWREGFRITTTAGRGAPRPTDAWPIVVVPPVDATALLPANPAVDRFVAEIPARIRELVRPYQFGQCLLLRSLATATPDGAAAADVFVGNPNLLWLLALGAYEGRVASSDVETLCRRRQVDVLLHLTRTGTRAQVKFLRKVRLAEGTLSEARALHEAACDPALVHALRHLPAVPANALEVFTRDPRLANEAFVPQIAAKFRAAEAGGRAQVDALIARLGALASTDRRALEPALRAACTEPPTAPVRRTPRAPAPGQSPLPFPPPLLPGTDTIVPIADARELEAEGRSQRHCVLTYAERIRQGRSTIYRVLAPERATLEIRRCERELRVGEFKLACNAEPDARSWDAVREWLARHAR